MPVICDTPVLINGYALGCGRCIPCRVRSRRVWTHRIMLESMLHEYNCFLTLTYRDEDLPKDGSVSPRHLMLFFKKLRRKLEPERIRYYAVGEYGERTRRPHYHAAVFGMRSCDFGATRCTTNYRTERGTIGVCCKVCNAVRDLWEYGNVYLGQLEARSCSYVAGYITKSEDKSILEAAGLRAPFSRMSNRPGIGAYMMDEVADTLLRDGYEKEMDDVPAVLRHGGHYWPIGRYLRKLLRERIGREPEAPKTVFEAMDLEMQEVRRVARQLNPARGQFENTVRGLIQDVTLGKRLQLKGKVK